MKLNMNDESKRFRDSMYMGSGSQDNITRLNREEFGKNSDARRSRPRSIAEHQYNVVRGSARRAKRAQDKAKREAKARLQRVGAGVAALLLAAGIGMGGLAVKGSLEADPKVTVTELQENGISASKLGLDNSTFESMQKYDEYFKNFDPNNLNLSENEILNMVDEIGQLNYDVMREKVANLYGVNASKVDYRIRDLGQDGSQYAVSIEKQDGETVNYVKNTFPFDKDNKMPGDIELLAIHDDTCYRLKDELKEDKISKVNAVKTLKRYYRDASKVATSELSLDEKGNIEMKEYEEVKDKDLGEER